MCCASVKRADAVPWLRGEWLWAAGAVRARCERPRAAGCGWLWVALRAVARWLLYLGTAHEPEQLRAGGRAAWGALEA